MDSKKRMKRANFILIWGSALMNYVMINNIVNVPHAVAISVFWDTLVLTLMAIRYNYYRITLRDMTMLEKIGKSICRNVALYHPWYQSMWIVALVNYIILERFGYTEVPMVSSVFIDVLILWGRDYTGLFHCNVARIFYGWEKRWR